MPFSLFSQDDKKLFVLSIDGVPFSLLERAFREERLPNLAALSRNGAFVRMNSVIPTISSVAWATFMTGVNPAKHQIFGFVDRDDEMHMTITTGHDVSAPTLWKRLNEAGKRAVVINVPVTFPPKPMDGVLVAGFLSPSLDKAVYPASLAPALKGMGYMVDPDPWKAKEDRDAFMEDLHAALKGRREATFHFLENEDWDFFMCHVMETDRINHFYWEAVDDPNAKYHGAFWDFYEAVDAFVGDVQEALSDDVEFVVLSDHGFCGVKHEVDINAYLAQEGFLQLRHGGREPADVEPSSQAYSMIPGRIFVNLEGRERAGSVSSAQYESTREELAQRLLDLEDPESGDPVIQHVYRREELYEGPYFDRAADLIAHPQRGYDLKAKFDGGALFQQSHRIGMHTCRDAALFVRGHDLTTDDATSILDVPPTLFELMGLSVPDELDGRSLLAP